MVATALISGHKRAVVLASEKFEGEVETDSLGKKFVEFCHSIQNDYHHLDYAYCDSDEDFLFKCIRDASEQSRLSVNVRKAANDDVNNRIRLTTRLLTQGRLFLTQDCETLAKAFTSSVWSEKKSSDSRSDSSDVGTLNAFEYTIERESARFLD